MKILLTGAAGFVGSNIFNKLNDGINSITVIDNLKTGYLSNLPSDVDFIHLDCSDEILLKRNDNYDCIIHVAGQASKEGSFNDVFYDLNSNVKSTLVLLEYAKKIKCKRFIFISSVCVYGGTSNPGTYSENSEINYDTFYSIHKYTSEKYLMLYKKYYDIDYTIFRLFTCYGPGQDLTNTTKGMVSIYLNQFLNKTPNVVIKGSLERYRDFVYVEDVAYIVSDAITNIQLYNNIFNLGSGVRTTIRELLDVIQTEGNFKKNIVVEDEVIGDMIGCVADNTKLKNIYKNSFKFTELNEGIRNMITFYS
jgi:UDP-glucose 4-epimerase